MSMIIEAWIAVVMTIIVFMYLYWHVFFRGPIDLFDVSILFYHKYLLEEKSILNKLFITKQNTMEDPRFKQIAWLFMFLFMDSVLMIISAIIATITMQKPVISFIITYIRISFFSGLMMYTLCLLIVVVQARKCSKRSELLSSVEYAKLTKEINGKHPNFYSEIF